MRRPSTIATLIAVFALLAIGSHWFAFGITSRVLHEAMDVWEVQKVKAVGQQVIGLLENESHRVQLTARLAAGRNSLSRSLARRPVDMATVRAVLAQAYAAGRSYREVAEELGMSPVTVRHHLRSAYTKLDVQDKAMLARVLSGPD